MPQVGRRLRGCSSRVALREAHVGAPLPPRPLTSVTQTYTACSPLPNTHAGLLHARDAGLRAGAPAGRAGRPACVGEGAAPCVGPGIRLHQAPPAVRDRPPCPFPRHRRPACPSPACPSADGRLSHPHQPAGRRVQLALRPGRGHPGGAGGGHAPGRGQLARAPRHPAVLGAAVPICLARLLLRLLHLPVCARARQPAVAGRWKDQGGRAGGRERTQGGREPRLARARARPLASRHAPTSPALALCETHPPAVLAQRPAGGRAGQPVPVLACRLPAAPAGQPVRAACCAMRLVQAC